MVAQKTNASSFEIDEMVSDMKVHRKQTYAVEFLYAGEKSHSLIIIDVFWILAETKLRM